MKLSSSASFESPQLPLRLHSTRPSHRLLLKFRSSKIPKLSKPLLTPPLLQGQAGWSKKPSAPAAAPAAQPTQAAQARKKKSAALSPSVMQLDVPCSPAPPVWLSSMHPVAPHAPISQLPWIVPEQARRDRHLMAEGSAVAPLSCPQARTHTQVFAKKIKCVPLRKAGSRIQRPLGQTLRGPYTCVRARAHTHTHTHLCVHQQSLPYAMTFFLAFLLANSSTTSLKSRSLTSSDSIASNDRDFRRFCFMLVLSSFLILPK